MELEHLVNSETTTIVDVREPYEFARGHAEGAINIPLGSIPGRLNEFRQMKQPVVLYCVSGNRSGQAASYLRQQGVREAYNGGSLEEVIFYRSLPVSPNL